ncbi:hypothetical protein BD779DRAFT_1801684 [Infundibulicybe gibba]|nr:hypothetical protein BD779DRAFT_1801684 [Infundibulicybe gibba]
MLSASIIAPPLMLARNPEPTTTMTTTTNTPFFPDPSTLTPPSQSPSPQSPSNNLAKSVLEYLFLAVVIILAGCVVARRFHRLKQSGQPLSHFFTLSRSDNDHLNRTGHYHGLSYNPHHLPHYRYRTAGSPLAPLPLVYGASRRTRAADIDEGGRRLPGSGINEYDHDVLSDKDVLPAYDNIGGPPKYADLTGASEPPEPVRSASLSPDPVHPADDSLPPRPEAAVHANAPRLPTLNLDHRLLNTLLTNRTSVVTFSCCTVSAYVVFLVSWNSRSKASTLCILPSKPTNPHSPRSLGCIGRRYLADKQCHLAVTVRDSRARQAQRGLANA